MVMGGEEGCRTTLFYLLGFAGLYVELILELIYSLLPETCHSSGEVSDVQRM